MLAPLPAVRVRSACCCRLSATARGRAASHLERVHSLRCRTPKKAKTTICRLVLNLRSQFFQSRLFFSNQEKLRSTTHRFGNTAKRCNSVSFDNLYLRTNQRLYRRSKCLTRVTTVSKDFLYRPKIILVTFQCQQTAFSIRNIRRRYRKGIRQTLRVNRYMPLDTANLLARIVAFSMAVSVFFTLCASIIRNVVASLLPCLRRSATT